MNIFPFFQVKRLKDEIRRLSTAQRQNQSARDLDSTYVAPVAPRKPLVEKPIETVCSNCQNKPSKQPIPKPVYDDEAFMKHDGTGVFATGSYFLNGILDGAKKI